MMLDLFSFVSHMRDIYTSFETEVRTTNIFFLLPCSEFLSYIAKNNKVYVFASYL